jgi:8-oxo-dGTP pyrophosphatase MutT (NUDIX family)
MPASSCLAGFIAILNTAQVPVKLPDDPLPWECLDQEYLFRRPPWLVLRHQRFRLPTGREIADYWISEYPPWVNVVAVTPNDEFVFVRQYRPGIGAVHYELPAGVVEEGEALEAAARRELLEETGFGGGTWSLLASLSANPALQNNMTTTFLAEGVESIRSSTPDQTEDLRVHLVKVSDAVSLIDSGEMIQALHVAPLLRYLLRRALIAQGI